MRVRIYTNDAERIKAGLDPALGREYVEIDLSKLTQKQRDELVANGQLGGESDGDTIHLTCAVATQETVADALEKLAEERSLKEKEKVARIEAVVQKFLAMTQEELNTHYISDYADDERTAYNDPRLAERKTIREAYLKAEAEAKKEADAKAEAERKQRQAEREANEAELKAELKAKRQAASAAWSAEHGSERLRLCVAGGYACHKLYLQERAALELGEGWEVDTKDTAQIEDKANPSLEALKVVQSLPNGFEGEVVWMTNPPNKSESDYDFQSQEAIWIKICPFTNVDLYKLMDC